jgi:hypothetical protein
MFRSQEQGGYDPEEMAIIGDIIKSMMMKSATDPIDAFQRITDRGYRENAEREDALRDATRDKQLIHPGAPIDMSADPASMISPYPVIQQPPPMEQPRPPMIDEFGDIPPGEITMYTDADRSPPRGMDDFQQANPDLDYDAVAAQSGGATPGGSFSAASRSDVPYAQSDEALFKFVNEQIPLYEARRKLDPRSRAHDPQGAELLMMMASQQRRDSAYEIGQIAERQKAETADKEAMLMESLVEQGMIPSGLKQPSAEPASKVKVADIIKLANEVIDNVQGDSVEMDMMAVKGAITVGNEELALRLLAKYIPSIATSLEGPGSAPPPPGVEELGEGFAVAPDGKTLVFTG